MRVHTGLFYFSLSYSFAYTCDSTCAIISQVLTLPHALAFIIFIKVKHSVALKVANRNNSIHARRREISALFLGSLDLILELTLSIKYE
jgi:hypothetical protein